MNIWCLIIGLIVLIIIIVIAVWWWRNRGTPCKRKQSSDKSKPLTGIYNSQIDYATYSTVKYRIPVFVEYDNTNNGEQPEVNFLTLDIYGQEFIRDTTNTENNIANDIKSFVDWNVSVNFTTDGTWGQNQYIIPNAYNNISPTKLSNLNVSVEVPECQGTNKIIYLILTILPGDSIYLVGRISATLADVYPKSQYQLFSIEKIED